MRKDHSFLLIKKSECKMFLHFTFVDLEKGIPSLFGQCASWPLGAAPKVVTTPLPGQTLHV